MRVLVILFLFSIISITTGRYTSGSGPRRGKIIGGNEARPRSHPYLVSLHMRFMWSSLRICTGSLLSEKWILTAGHCIKGNWLTNWLPMEAMVGTNDLVEKASTVQTVRIADRQVHPLYRGRIGAYDIAMLKTTKNIQFNSAVYPIALPFAINYKPNDKNLILAGWGDLDTTAFMPAFHNKLQEASVLNFPFEECVELVESILSNIEDIDESPMYIATNICSWGVRRRSGGVTACSGDSGAPLIQYVALDEQASTSSPSDETEPWSKWNTNTENTTSKNKDSDETSAIENNPVENEITVADLVQQYKDQGLTPVAIGVVSWGPCGLVGAPTVYNNVSFYADFIQQHLDT